MPTSHAPRERDEIDLVVLHSVLGQLRRQMEHLDRVRGHTGACQREGKAFGSERGLRGGLEEDGVARNERREHGVYGNEVGIAVARTQGE